MKSDNHNCRTARDKNRCHVTRYAVKLTGDVWEVLVEKHQRNVYLSREDDWEKKKKRILCIKLKLCLSAATYSAFLTPLLITAIMMRLMIMMTIIMSVQCVFIKLWCASTAITTTVMKMLSVN